MRLRLRWAVHRACWERTGGGGSWFAHLGLRAALSSTTGPGAKALGSSWQDAAGGVHSTGLQSVLVRQHRLPIRHISLVCKYCAGDTCCFICLSLPPVVSPPSTPSPDSAGRRPPQSPRQGLLCSFRAIPYPLVFFSHAWLERLAPDVICLSPTRPWHLRFIQVNLGLALSWRTRAFTADCRLEALRIERWQTRYMRGGNRE